MRPLHATADLSQLPHDLRDEVRAELDGAERLVWVGQPIASRTARRALALSAFGVVFTAFALVWIALASGMLGKRGPDTSAMPTALRVCFPLWGAPFALVGLGMTLAPLWASRAARRTVYIITDRRVILWKGSAWGEATVRSYRGDALGSLVRRESADGSGDLIFEEQHYVDTRPGRDRRRHAVRHGFIAIPDVRQVEDLLRRALLTKDE